MFCDCTPENQLWSKKGSLKRFPLRKLAVQILIIFGSTELLWIWIFKYELLKEQVVHLYDK